MGYVLDTNVFTESKNRYYAFDIAPKFWTSLVQRVQAADYLEEAKTVFAGVADGWVIAYAKASGRTVVSHETRADPASRRRVKIPDVCDAFSIPYIGLFQMLRDLGIVFS